jgi:dTDP-4-dehydrorhamnose reductase
MPETPDILLISHDGMLGRAWLTLLQQQARACDTVTFPQIDYTKPDTIADHVRDGHKLVINCAAYTDVDGCETQEQLANQINGHGVGVLAQRCREIGATLVHYSTDYVFNGEQQTPYRVDQPHEPVNAYGRSKAIGEKRIRDTGCRHLILRTSWLYAPWGKNFVRTIHKAARERQSLRVVNDQHGRPTSAEHLADASKRLLDASAHGTLHVTDGGQCTWHAFATRIAAHANPACQVQPCTSDEYQRPAKRPAYSVMDLGPTEAIIGPMPAWETNLDAVLERLDDEKA